MNHRVRLLAVLFALVASQSLASDVSITSTHMVKSNYLVDPGIEVEDGPVTQNDVTVCYGNLCGNAWISQSLEHPGNNTSSAGNEIDLTPSYTFGVGPVSVYADYGYYARLKGGSTDLHAATLKVSAPIGGGIQLYVRNQIVHPIGQGGDIKEGGNLSMVGGTKTFAQGRYSVGLKIEGVHDDGVGGDESGWLARAVVSPSIDMGWYSIDLGLRRDQQLNVSDRGNHTQVSVGMTIKMLAPKK